MMEARRLFRSQNARGSAVIAFSMSAAGLGYFVFGLLPGTSYSSRELSILSVWQALSFGAGLVVASPLNGVVYTELLRARGDLADDGFSGVCRAVVLVGVTTSVLLLVSSLIANSLFNGDLLLAGLAALSVSLQIVAALQRAVFSALGRWHRFSAQFLVEGIGRVLFSALVVQFSDSLRLLVLMNVVSQLISVVVAGRPRSWWPRLATLRNPNWGIVLRSVAPYLLAGFTIQSTLSMTPFYARTLAGVSSIGIAALGGLVQILRIPTTLTVAIVMPRVRNGAQFLLDGVPSAYRRLVTRTVGLLSGLWFAYGVLVAVVLRSISSRLTYGIEFHIDVLMLATLVCALGPVSTYLHTSFMFHQRFREASQIWGVCLVIFVAGCTFGSSSVSGILGSVVGSLGFASLALYRANIGLGRSRGRLPDDSRPIIGDQ